jgi:hypothetical protein
MEEPKLVLETTLKAMGKEYPVRIFQSPGGKHFAMTSFSDTDIIVSDGVLLEDTLAAHARSLPLAVSCRNRQDAD